MTQPTYQDRVEAQGNASVNCPTSSRNARPEPSLTWAELVALEPRLAAVEKEARRRRRMRRGGDQAWYGYGRHWAGHGLKEQLLGLVGWCRRSSEWGEDWPDGIYTLDDLLLSPRAIAEEDRRKAVRAEDTAAGLGMLWTSEAYSLAYGYLAHLCFYCRRRCCQGRTE